MLLSEDRCGNQHCNLLPVDRGLESRPERYLSFAKSNVSTEQPVHGHRLFHVPLHIYYGPPLIGCLLVRKEIFELLLPHCVGRERITLHRLPGRMQPEQVFRHVLHRLAHSGFGTRPFCPSKFIQAGRRIFHPYVFLQKRNLVSRDINPILAGVLNQEVVALDPGHLQGLHSAVFANSMIDVDHIVPGRQIRVTGNPCTLFNAGKPPPLLPPPVYLSFCKNQKLDVGTLKSGRELAFRHANGASLRNGLQSIARDRRDALLLEELGKSRTPFPGRRYTDYSVLPFTVILDLVNKIVEASRKYLCLLRLGHYVV